MRNLVFKQFLMLIFILSMLERTGVSIVSFLISPDEKSSKVELLLDDSDDTSSEQESEKSDTKKEFYGNASCLPTINIFVGIKLSTYYDSNTLINFLYKPSVPTPPPDFLA